VDQQMKPATSAFEHDVTAFEQLSPGSIDRLLAIGRAMTFEVDDMVLHEGRATPYLALLESGRVALRLRAPELGHPVSIMTIEPGELLGWSAIVPPYRATVDAIATEPTTILAIDGAALRAELGANAALAVELLPIVLQTVSERLAASWHQVLGALPAGCDRAVEPW
jgi:CRP-like cAMP-binding protein